MDEFFLYSFGFSVPCVQSPLYFSARPRIEAAQLRGEIGVGPGESLELPCPALGNPKPKVAWLFNGHIIDAQSGEYTILVRNLLNLLSLQATF